MSEYEIEDNENAIVASEETESETKKADTLQPAVKKKGSFLSFLAFVFSLAALGLSAYMYYIQYLLDQPQSNENAWQQPLEELQSQIKNNADKVQDLALKIAKMKSNSQSLTEQLSSIKDETSSKNLNTKTYDDSKFNKSIANLRNELTEQNKQQSQALSQFKQRYENEKSNQPSNVKSAIDSEQKQKAINQDLIVDYLLAAHKNLNVSGNVNLAIINLKKAVNKLKELSDKKFLNLVEDLNNTVSELNSIKKVNVFDINRNIDALESSVNNLSFVKVQKAQEKQSSSWYDNLVKIKKIDESEQKLLTQSEQAAIRQTLKLHFDLLRSALISQNMDLWVSEIETISALIKKHFAETQDKIQDSIIQQFSELKHKDINPSLPDLSIYLQQFNALLNTAAEGE